MTEPEQGSSNRQLNQTQQQAVYEDEIDLRELFMVLWRGRWVIVVITFMAAVISVFIALSLPNIYRAEALLAPASSEESGGLAGLASQYGGLASLAGINLAGGGADKTALGIEVLKSRKFIGEFIQKHDALVALMASEGWDRGANELNLDSSIYDTDNEVWIRDANPPRLARPSLQEAHIEFNKLLSVSQDSETGFVRISVEHYSPYIAKQWVDFLVEDINSEIKRQDVSEAKGSIVFLQDQLAATPLADLQTVFYQLIEEQTKTIMLANARPEYLFKTLDPAVVREEPSGPNRLLICVIGFFLGGLLGAAYVVFENYVNRVKV